MKGGNHSLVCICKKLYYTGSLNPKQHSVWAPVEPRLGPFGNAAWDGGVPQILCRIEKMAVSAASIVREMALCMLIIKDSHIACQQQF